MFGGFLSSVAFKVLAATTGVAGVVGGLAAAGALPSMSGDSSTRVEVTTPVGGATAETDVADLSQLPAGSEAAEALALINQAQASVDSATAAAEQCMAQTQSQLEQLLAAVSSITTQVQANALLGEAKAIGSDAQQCAARAQVLGQTAVNDASAAALGVAGLGDLAGIPNPDDVLAQLTDASGLVSQAATAVQAMANELISQIMAVVSSLVGGELGDLPVPGDGQGGLPIPGLGEGGLPLPGLGDGELPIPNIGDLPVPPVDVPGSEAIVDAAELAAQIGGAVLDTLGATILPLPVF